MAEKELMYRRRAFLVIGLVAIYHLIIIGAVGPGDNESYYWTWSKHLAWSYFDHPPAIAWMIALTTSIGGDSTFSLRIGTVILFALSSAFIYLLAQEMTGSRRTAFFSLLLANLIPLYFLVGILTVPDAPLTFFWVVYLYLLYKVIHRAGLGHWLLMGVVLGLAFLSKYFAVLLVPSTALFLASDNRLRRYFKTPGPYLAFALSGVVASPVLFWNIREKWASFTFQLSSRHEQGFVWKNIWDLIVGQSGVVTPFLFLLLIMTLFIFIRRSFMSDGGVKDRFIVMTSAPTLLFFYTAMCLTTEGEPHWPGLGYLPLLIGASWLYCGLQEKREGQPRKYFEEPERAVLPPKGLLLRAAAARRLAAVSLAPPVLFLLAMNIQLIFPVYRPGFSQVGPESNLTGWEVARQDPISDLFGWEETAARVKEIAREMAALDDPPFIFTGHYNPASQLSFALKDTHNVFCLSEGTDQFDFWQVTEDLVGRNAVYVTTSRYYLPPAPSFVFDSIEGPEKVEIFRAGKYKIREAYLYRCYNFSGLNGESGSRNEKK